MGHPVIIVEKEEKAKTIQEQFSSEIESLVVSSAPVKALAIPPVDELKRESLHFKFEPLPEQKSFIDKLLASQGKEIYIAMDGDQRGEYWAWLISEYFQTATQGKQLPKRLHVTGFNEEELRASFRLVEAVQKEKATTFYVRMLLDAHLAKHLQRLIGTPSGPDNLPLSYYSLTTLFMLAEREDEIRMFTPPEKWQVSVTLATDKGPFTAKLEEAYGIIDDGVLQTAEQAKRAVEMFKDKPFVVAEVDRTPVEIHPPAPYRLAQLLTDAYLSYRISPKQVLAAIQKLFYGVAFKGKLTSLISSYLPSNNAKADGLLDRIKKYIAAEHGESAVRSDAGTIDMSGAILPLQPGLKKEDIDQVLSKEEQQVYELIRNRAVAALMNDARGENIIVDLNAGEECIFQASMRSITEKGFLEVYSELQFEELLKPCPLVGAEAGMPVRCEQIVPEHGGGFPAEYYNFESLAAEWEDFGISLDSVSILMLQYMMDKGYVALMPDGSMHCRENTFKLYSVMKRAFPTMVGIHLSAYFHQTVDEVVSGRKTLAFAVKQFDQTLMMRGEVLIKVSIPQQLRKRARTSSSIIKTVAEQAVPAPASTPPPRQPDAGPEETRVQLEAEAPLIPEAEVPASAPPEAETGKEAETFSAGEQQAEETMEVQETTEMIPSEPAEGVEVEQPAAGVPFLPEEEASEGVAETAFEPEEIGGPLEAGVTPVLETEEERREWERVFSEAASRSEEDTTEEKEKVLEGPHKECPDCGRPLLLKEDRFGKYWYCSGHPECRHSQSYDKESGPEMLCPLCGVGNIISKHTPTGKIFFVCPEKECEFMAWSKPYDVSCQVCDSPFLVEKKDVGGKVLLRCPRAGCNYMQPLPGESATVDGSSSAQPAKRKVRVRRVAKGSGGSVGGKTRKVRVVRRK